jgi:hypothetical protein
MIKRKLLTESFGRTLGTKMIEMPRIIMTNKALTKHTFTAKSFDEITFDLF